MESFLEGKRILVTGGTGSMGKTFVRRVLSGECGNPEKIIVFSRDEGKHHQMRLEYLHRKVSTEEVTYNNFKNLLEFRIGDVRSYQDVSSACKDVDIVINAAALKQVPSCEYFPYQALLTNCLGAENIVRAIRENNLKVEIVVGVSTDKAAKPVNVMGMTKAIQERIFTTANILNPSTKFMCVRYGNVLASRGSVIPLFYEQIKNGGPVTLTVPSMTRFLISLDDAVDTIFAVMKNGNAGETFVPNAPSATVENIAKALIGHREIGISVTGIRPGEKMHEIMISEEEINHCYSIGDYYAIQSMLPELQGSLEGKISLTKEYSSNDEVLDLKGTIGLLKKNNLLNFSKKTNEFELLR
ncbi:MAG: polysaccharide biosynthesis protein [Bacteriovoracaceae bacterium]|nr:polysaccharide biosynthesis protein [Bacteriovoracaceae bacterium]